MTIWPSRGIAIAILFSNLVLITAPTHAADKDDQRAGNARFTLPRGWVRSDRGGAAILTPANLPKGRQAMMMILPSRENDGTLRAWFDRTWQELTGEHKLIGGGEPTAREGSEKNVEIIYAAGLFQDKSGQEICILLFGANGGDHVESFVFLADGRDLYERYGKAVQEFMTSLQFENVRVAPADARPAGASQPATKDKLQGLWVGPSHAIWYNSTPILSPYGAPNTVGFRSNYMYFFPDGRVISKVPREGLGNFDFKSFQKDRPEDCGTYTINGDEIRIAWPKQSLTATFKPDGKLSYRSGTWTHLPACDGLKLNGIYASSLISDKGVADAHISFGKAGKFREINFLNNSAGKGGAGRYRILRNTLELTYDDGTIRREFFWVDQEQIGKAPIDAIVVADKVLDLRKPEAGNEAK